MKTRTGGAVVLVVAVAVALLLTSTVWKPSGQGQPSHGTPSVSPGVHRVTFGASWSGVTPERIEYIANKVHYVVNQANIGGGSTWLSPKPGDWYHAGWEYSIQASVPAGVNITVMIYIDRQQVAIADRPGTSEPGTVRAYLNRGK